MLRVGFSNHLSLVVENNHLKVLWGLKEFNIIFGQNLSDTLDIGKRNET
jgi:hypothetical protein